MESKQSANGFRGQSAREPRKPNLFIVGAPKCGTTAWVEYLKSHPDIFFPVIKEPHYFSPDIPKPEGFNNFPTEERYLALFAQSGDARIVGEGSVRYLQSREAARNIREFNPDAKIIIFVRDQQDYLPSLHNQLVFNKDECIADFHTAWRLSGKRDATNTSRECRSPKLLDYMEAGKFSAQVDRFFSHFPDDQIRVYHFRDWSPDPRAAYLDILKFLGVPDDGRTDFPRVNPARRRRTNFLWKLQKNPPRIARAAVALTKRVTGRHTLGLIELLRRIDTKKGGQTTVSDAVRQEIAAYFRADNAELERRISRID
jgi:hypothetical protein